MARIEVEGGIQVRNTRTLVEIGHDPGRARITVPDREV